jgi:hypothetical protein
MRISFSEKLGNMISGFFGIIDGIFSIITLGNWSPDLSMWFEKWRMRNGYLADQLKEK